MIRVKEFISTGDAEGSLNRWLENSYKNIKVIDIKHSITCSSKNELIKSYCVIYEMKK